MLSLSKLAHAMELCLEGVEPADKQLAGRYIFASFYSIIPTALPKEYAL